MHANVMINWYNQSPSQFISVTLPTNVAIPVEPQVEDLENLCNTDNATLGLAPKEYTLEYTFSEGFPKNNPYTGPGHKWIQAWCTII